jgi:hypothetical protein
MLFVVLAAPSSGQGIFVHKYFAKWTVRRRILALAAAYAIALSGIIAGFSAGRAVAATPDSPGTVTCHTETAADPPPTGSQDDSKTCANSCCTGCLMLVAALPAPPAKAIGTPQSPGQILPMRAVANSAFSPQTKSHRSRAPPFGV